MSIGFATSITLDEFHESSIHKFLKSALSGGAEGIMVRLSGRPNSQTAGGGEEASTCDTLDCPYESGNFIYKEIHIQTASASKEKSQ